MDPTSGGVAAAPRSGSSWAWRAGGVVIPLTFLLLITQYLLGLWTNAYAPSGGFTADSSFAPLNWHWNIGFTLGIVSIVAIVLTAFTRNWRVVLPAGLVFLFVLMAGLAGNAFTDTPGNPPQYSFLMGASFLFAFISEVALARIWMTARSRDARRTTASTTTASVPG